ncbi:hypothetical protein KP78_05670 [Jeotgalibacillus soli]|uniref:Uncharacterized protein n=1 Tax=Jeotgalibacillus soli TaxID=889306 RepID=A0A0C2VTE2_9BACL|nr:hypothetical protein KP78_05670 [Jeotgalibacillus soli]
MELLILYKIRLFSLSTCHFLFISYQISYFIPIIVNVLYNQTE